MKQFLLVCALVFLVACNSPVQEMPPPVYVRNYDRALQKRPEGWFYKGGVFSGYIVECDRTGPVLFRKPVLNGLEEGLAWGVYSTGQKLMQVNYHKGSRQGMFRQWWPNGHYRYLLNYNNGVYNGTQLIFYPGGTKRQELNYANGVLEGRQRVWDENGRLVSNYVVKNNRIYGIVQAQVCMPHGH